MNIFGALNTTSACELMASNCRIIEANRKINRNNVMLMLLIVIRRIRDIKPLVKPIYATCLRLGLIRSLQRSIDNLKARLYSLKTQHHLL